MVLRSSKMRVLGTGVAFLIMAGVQISPSGVDGTNIMMSGWSPECNLTGFWVMSHAEHNQPSKDNMTMIQNGQTFNVTCSTEKWKQAQGILSPSWNTPTWDKLLNITFPPNYKHHQPFTHRGIATFGPGCTNLKLYWEDNSVWCQGLKEGGNDCGGQPNPLPPAPSPPPPPPPPSVRNITKAYIVFSNHLDVGYTLNTNGSCAGAVVNEYFQIHFPNAIKTGQQIRNTTQRQYRWMTQSWLVSMYRHCNESIINRFGGPDSDIICPNEAKLAAFEASVKLGDITWHAFPHNSEPEMFDEGLFLSALNLTFTEDDYYGHPHRKTLSQRDVPGLTRAAIPLLNRYGVKGITVGENGACAPVNVPPIFVWKDNATDTQVIAMFHPHGYGVANTLGLQPDEVPEGIQANSPRPVSMSDCVIVPAAHTALCYAWRGDNLGPHDSQDALSVFKTVESLFPNAHVVASDAFDDFVEDVLPVADTLPVVTAEIGDTWIQGADSDPLKVAQYRAASRLRQACITSGECDPTSPEMMTFDRLLIKLGEHTWGWNGGDIRTKSWSNDLLASSLKTDKDFQTAPLTWFEQRAFITNAVAALPATSSLRQAIETEFAALVPVSFDRTGFTPMANPTAPIDLGQGGHVQFDTTGAMVSLVAPGGKTDWASPAHPLGRLWYQNMDNAYFDTFTQAYNGNKKVENFAKPNLNLSAINSNFSVSQLLTRSSGTTSSIQVLVLLSIDNTMAFQQRGAPNVAEVMFNFSTSGGFSVDVTAQWFNKTMTHAPETIWFSNTPAVSSKTSWTMDKLGTMMNPLDADLDGIGGGQCVPDGTTCGVHLHAVGNRGVQYTGPEGTLTMTSVDSALVSVGSATPVPTPLTVPDPLGGIHFALVGNIWNTNYPFWYPWTEEDAASRFRFTFTFGNS
eukprot:m.185439 g.185439  ORF g.185439 m.185439 type:complete len:909 (-) comp16452_c0_seq1:57-2783(-)